MSQLAQRWYIDGTTSGVSTVVSASDDKCTVVSLEESVRLTEDQTIFPPKSLLRVLSPWLCGFLLQLLV